MKFGVHDRMGFAGEYLLWWTSRSFLGTLPKYFSDSPFIRFQLEIYSTKFHNAFSGQGARSTQENLHGGRPDPGD